jgi:arylsulfatase A-like enzyme
VNRPYRGWKQTLFEGGIHVPFFMKWPGRIEPRSVVEAPAHHFDLFATAAAAADAPLPSDRTIDGLDLVPYVTGEATGVPHRALFWRSGASQTALVDGWKLNVSDPPGTEWLYDLRSDPTERNSLATDRTSWRSFVRRSPRTMPIRRSPPGPGRRPSRSVSTRT